MPRPTFAEILAAIESGDLDDRFYRVSALAELLDVSTSTIYRAIEAGELAALRMGRSLRVPGSALAAWLTACGLTAKVLTAELTPADDGGQLADSMAVGR